MLIVLMIKQILKSEPPKGNMAGAQTATDLKKDMAEESKCELVRFFWASKSCNKELLRLS